MARLGSGSVRGTNEPHRRPFSAVKTNSSKVVELARGHADTGSLARNHLRYHDSQPVHTGLRNAIADVPVASAAATVPALFEAGHISEPVYADSVSTENVSVAASPECASTSKSVTVTIATDATTDLSRGSIRNRKCNCLSCSRCHRLKVKCNMELPCARCESSGNGRNCYYIYNKGPNGGMFPCTMPAAPLSAKIPHSKTWKRMHRMRGSSHWGDLVARVSLRAAEYQAHSPAVVLRGLHVLAVSNEAVMTTTSSELFGGVVLTKKVADLFAGWLTDQSSQSVRDGCD